MKIQLVSDLHKNLPHVSPCELLIIAGDITWEPYGATLKQHEWIHREFAPWLAKLPAKHIVGIAGNHDQIFETDRHMVDWLKLKWIYLEDDETVVEGLKIWGTPWTPHFCDWAFNADEYTLERVFSFVPEDTDILISHGPPAGFLDVNKSGKHCGSLACLQTLKRVKPKLFVCGHVHEGYGYLPYKHEDGSITHLVNCSLVNSGYDAVNAPFAFNYEDGNMTLVKVS